MVHSLSIVSGPITANGAMVDSHLLQYKARLCTDGCQKQYGVDFFESYVLLIMWSIVCLMHLLSALLNLHCQQVDSTQAFPQANIDVPVFLQLPAGWWYTNEHGNTDYCLELKKNLYSTKQAAGGWFLHLHDGLKSNEFTQSNIDPCLFFHSDCILIVYTDNCLIFGPSAQQDQAVITTLQQTFLMNNEGKVKDFLGIHIAWDPQNGTFTLTQPGFIDPVINDLGLLSNDLTPVKHKFTPTLSILHPDLNGLP